MPVNARASIVFEALEPRSVTVTLFTGDDGAPRGWYTGPPGCFDDPSLVCRTDRRDNLDAAVAIIRAWEIACELQIALRIVDPDQLWPTLVS